MQHRHPQRPGGQAGFWRETCTGGRVAVLSRIGKAAATTATTTMRARWRLGASCSPAWPAGGAGCRWATWWWRSTSVQHDMDASPMFPRWELPRYGSTGSPRDPALTHAFELPACRASARQTGGRQPGRAHRGAGHQRRPFVSTTAGGAARCGSARAGHECWRSRWRRCHRPGLPRLRRAVCRRAHRVDRADTAHGDFRSFQEVFKRTSAAIIGKRRRLRIENSGVLRRVSSARLPADWRRPLKPARGLPFQPRRRKYHIGPTRAGHHQRQRVR